MVTVNQLRAKTFYSFVSRGGPRDIPPSPTITLSQYWDDDDGVSDDGGGSNGRSGSWGSNFHDSVIEVNSVGGNSHRSSKSAAKVSFGLFD